MSKTGIIKYKIIILFLFFHNLVAFSFCRGNAAFEYLRFQLTGEYDTQIFSEDIKLTHVESLNVFFNRNFVDFKNCTIKSYADLFFPDEVTVLELSGFYIPSDDSAYWINDILAELEEDRITDELEEMNSVNEELNKEIEKFISETINEELLLQKNNTISFLKYDDEIFMPEKTKDFFITINASKDETIREFYDLKFRLVRKEIWSITNLKDSKILVSEEYTYKENSVKPSRKVIYKDGKKEFFDYNSQGLITQHREYTLYNDLSYLTEIQTWKYNNENKILEDKKIQYIYKQDFSLIDEVFEKKHLFVYNNWKDIPANEEYYEDGKLKLRSKYSEKPGFYTVQVYFDNDFSVKTIYEDGKKFKEVFTMNGEVWRVKEYEKK